MTDDRQEQEITTQILIQIRDEMRSMGSRFQRGLDGVEAHLEDVKKRLDSLETHLGSLGARMDSVESRMDSLESRIASLPMGLASIESKNETYHQQFLKHLDRIDSDLKNFVGLVNDTILHYADEMDSVRDRLDMLEKGVGYLPPSE